MRAQVNSSASSVLDSLLDQQKQSWLRGDRPSIESLLGNSSLPPNSDALLDLLYNEIVVREELGESPSLDEYIERYPELSEDLRLHFDVHKALQEEMLGETLRLDNVDSVPNVNSDSDESPSTLADYEIIGELGRGGMGVVYKARHRRLKRLVALKMFEPGRIPSRRELTRFQSEAETVARLQHPNIIQIFEIGRSNGLPFLALELAEKGTLARRLQELPFTPRAAAELIETLARAVQHAHDQQVIHRDLKPANILFATDGTVKISDFGLAKLLEADSDSPRDATQTGEPLGTPRYMAPEQAAGTQDQIGPATDVYALGTLLFECLTGQVPFVSASAIETMDKIRHAEPVSPRKLQRSVTRNLETICLKCLHKEPRKRYASARSLADDLRRFLDGKPIEARPTPSWERVAMWCRRRPAFATSIAMGIIAVLGGMLALGWQREAERRRLADLRSEVAVLMKEGQEAVARQDNRTAQARFLAAWSKVLAEPSLHDLVAGVSGWLDHSRRDAEQQLWKRRQPPQLFDERKDEAFIRSIIFDPKNNEDFESAMESIQTALELTIDNDPAWAADREQLLILESTLFLRRGDYSNALATLDRFKGVESRIWHTRRAICLDRLGRDTEAAQERNRAEQFPPAPTYGQFLESLELMGKRDYPNALGKLDQILLVQPEHFLARFFQAFCFLENDRPDEARVALTACVAQRPRSIWSHLLRARASLALGRFVEAAQDLQWVFEMKGSGQVHRSVEAVLTQLNQAIANLPAAQRNQFFSSRIQTEAGPALLRELPLFVRSIPSTTMPEDKK